jgi:hypothetical protein
MEQDLVLVASVLEVLGRAASSHARRVLLEYSTTTMAIRIAAMVSCLTESRHHAIYSFQTDGY